MHTHINTQELFRLSFFTGRRVVHFGFVRVQSWAYSRILAVPKQDLFLRLAQHSERNASDFCFTHAYSVGTTCLATLAKLLRFTLVGHSRMWLCARDTPRSTGAAPRA